MKILDLHEKRITEPVEEFEPIIKDYGQVCDWQKLIADSVIVPPLIKHYVAEVIRYTRVREEVSWGSSPRAGIFLMKSAQAYAHQLQQNATIFLFASCSAAASICPSICSSVKCLISMALNGHSALQVPHPAHAASMNSAFFLSLSIEMAL